MTNYVDHIELVDLEEIPEIEVHEIFPEDFYLDEDDNENHYQIPNIIPGRSLYLID